MGLLGDRVRVARERRHHRRAQFDPGHLRAHDRQCGQRIVAEDIGHPVGGEPVALDRGGLGDDVIKGSVVDSGAEDS